MRIQLRMSLLLLLHLLLAFASSLPSESISWKNRTQPHDHSAANATGNQQLLMWSVRLHVSNCTSNGSDAAVASSVAKCLSNAAIDIATAAGLRSFGQLPVFPATFTFAYWDSAWSLGNNNNNNTQMPTVAELLKRHSSLSNATQVKRRAERQLHLDGRVRWFSQEVLRSRQPRDYRAELNDPYLPFQWHLHSPSPNVFDVNVTAVWNEGVFGEGVTVSLLDDGVEYTNPDLMAAYNPKGSYDFNENDYDPMPTSRSATNHHGTRCAGEISAAGDNNFCGVGIAPKSNFSALKLLDGAVIDSMESMAYNYQFHGNYIYTSSWGPPDNGAFIDGPHLLARQALQAGVTKGRHKLGSIFIVASGNGGYFKDNCNYDGYASSEFTITIGAVTRSGHLPPYAEQCACIHAVTVSSGDGVGIVTADWQRLGGTGCTRTHGGTSAAAPLAAGMTALMLSVRPCLSWRDVQHIVVLTAARIDKEAGHYQRNGALLWHSHQHGFGLLSAWRLVTVAKVWEPMPKMKRKSSSHMAEFRPLAPKSTNSFFYDAGELQQNGDERMIVEHVKVFVSIDHPRRGQLSIGLRSPAGTYSLLANVRPHDASSAGLRWTFATVRCWGESPFGEWQLIVNNSWWQPGVFNTWRLMFIGADASVEDYQLRIGQVKKIVNGELTISSAKSCPHHAPVFTADGFAPSAMASFANSSAARILTKLPLIFNLIVVLCLSLFVYYSVYSSVSWCKRKYKERLEARSRRSNSQYAYAGPHPRSGGVAQRESASAPLASGDLLADCDLPPSYEEAISENTSLLAHYDTRSCQVTLPYSLPANQRPPPPPWRPLP